MALKFNNLLRTESKDAKLIVTNFPMVSQTFLFINTQPIDDNCVLQMQRLSNMDIMTYVGTLTKDIEPVIMVRGSGHEIVTSYE